MPTKDDRTLKLINSATDIRNRRAERRDTAYMVRELLLCTLPHRDPGDRPFFRRKNEDAALIVTPGRNFDGISYGLPFGVLPRLLLYWMVTEITRTKSRELELLGEGETARSYAAFMREVGLDPTRGGERSDSVRLRNAMLRLFTARIELIWNPLSLEHYERDAGESFQVTSRRMLWWDRKTKEMGIPSWIEISNELYAAVLRSVVPCDMRALHALKNSPMEMDLYAMLNYFGANRPNLVTWAELNRRLGAGYKDKRNLKRAVKNALVRVSQVHPHLQFELPLSGGLLVRPSEPAISREATSR